MMEPPSSSCVRCFLAESRADQPLERGIQELSQGDQEAPSAFYRVASQPGPGISPAGPGNSELGEGPPPPKFLNLPGPTGSPISTESDTDFVANLWPSGGMGTRPLALRTPVTESTLGPPWPAPSLPRSPPSQDQEKAGGGCGPFGSKALSLTSTLPFSLGTSGAIFLDTHKPPKGDPAVERPRGPAPSWAGAPSLSPDCRPAPAPTTLPWALDKPRTSPVDSLASHRGALEPPTAFPRPGEAMIGKDPEGLGEPLDPGAEARGKERERACWEGPGEAEGEGEDGRVIGEPCAGESPKPKAEQECWVASPKPSVEDSYGRQVREAGCMLLERLRRLFLDSDGHRFSLLDSGLALTTGGLPLTAGSQEHSGLRVAFLTMRNGRKLGVAFPGSNLFYYYSLGRHFFVTAQLSNHWFRVRDRVTGEWMLMKKVPVVSDWQKMLHHFLFLPPGPGLLVPYAVLYDRQGSLLYLMEDPGVLTVGWPPAAQQLDRLQCLREVLRFLRFCQQQGLQLEEVNSALLHTHQGMRFDPSGLSGLEGAHAYRKTLRSALRLVWSAPQDAPATEALLERMWRWLEEERVDAWTP